MKEAERYREYVYDPATHQMKCVKSWKDSETGMTYAKDAHYMEVSDYKLLHTPRVPKTEKPKKNFLKKVVDFFL